MRTVVCEANVKMFRQDFVFKSWIVLYTCVAMRGVVQDITSASAGVLVRSLPRPYYFG